MSSVNGSTSAQRSATRRRAAHTSRIRTAKGDRGRMRALVWWWMAEWCRLPADQKQEESGRLLARTKELNQGSLS